MYRVVIVDDENVIRNGLQNVVPFESLGFTVVGDAANGMEALQKCEELTPDLVITDIRMPIMDGLTMCKKIQAILPTTHFIIFSGYNDFEYARQAIDIRVMSYLLKPISSEEFSTVLVEVKDKLDHEFELRRNIALLTQNFQADLPQLRQQLLCSVLLGGIAPDKALNDGQRYGVPLTAQQYVLALAKISGQVNPANGDRIGDIELTKVAVCNIVREVVTPTERVHIFRFNGVLALLFLFDDDHPENLNRVAERMHKVNQTVSYYLGLSLAVGIGAPCQQLSQLPDRKNQAVSALEQSMFGGAEQILLITDVEPDSRTYMAADEVALRSLGNSLKMCDRDHTIEALRKLIEQLQSLACNVNTARIFLMEILLVFLRAARDVGVELDVYDTATPSGTSIYDRLMEYPSPLQARSELETLCDQLLARIDHNRVTTGQHLVAQALAYLQAHFSEEDMSIERLAQEIHISPSYFSSVFKKETNKTFHQALNELRMDKAMYLLTSTEWKSARIAMAVGIPDPSYFSYAFKRHFGCSPSSARARKETPS